jgi:hypothetical protein
VAYDPGAATTRIKKKMGKFKGNDVFKWLKNIKTFLEFLLAWQKRKHYPERVISHEIARRKSAETQMRR